MENELIAADGAVFDQINQSNLKDFMNSKEREILNLAKKGTEEIVKKEVALMDFELFLSSNLTDQESVRLTKESRAIRKQSWEGMGKKIGSYKEINKYFELF